jgi:hypothetical protein
MKTTDFEVIVSNIETMKLEIKHVQLFGTFKTDKEALKALKAVEPSIVQIKGYTVMEELRGMTEQTFLEHSVPLGKKHD